MTREEAKGILLQSKMQCDYPHGAYGVAVDMAIKALEQEHCEDCISRADVIKTINFFADKPQHFSVANLVDEVENMPSVQQEPCEDCVSREEVMNLVRYNAFHVKSQLKAIENMPSVQPKSSRLKAEDDGFKDAVELCKEVYGAKADVLEKIRKIVDKWYADSWTDGLSYDCMVRISELLEG